jgi:hypothetical protein
MELHTVSILIGRGRQKGYFIRESEFTDTAEGFSQYGLFLSDLGFVGQMLEGAGSAAGVEGAGRLGPQRGGFCQFYQLSPGPVLAFFSDPSDYNVSGGAEVHKDRLSPDMQETRPPGSQTFHPCGE